MIVTKHTKIVNGLRTFLPSVPSCLRSFVPSCLRAFSTYHSSPDNFIYSPLDFTGFPVFDPVFDPLFALSKAAWCHETPQLPYRIVYPETELR